MSPGGVVTGWDRRYGPLGGVCPLGSDLLVLGAATATARVLGGPLVLAPLTLVLVFLQDLDRPDAGSFAGDRTLAASRGASPVAAIAAGFLPGEGDFGNTDIFADDFIEIPFDIFGAHFQFASGAQRGRPALIDLLEPRAPEIKYQYRDGPVQRRYDSTGYTMSMQMGVDVVRVDTQFDVTTTTISTAVAPMPEVPSQARSGYALDPRINESYVVVNQLLAEGVEVYRSSGPLTIEAGELPAGTFMISRRTPEIADRMQQIASEMRVPVFTDPEGTGNSIPGEIFSARIGLYKPWQASMDEGWTRLTLENHGFSFENIDNARIREGDLGADFDVLIIPQGVQPRTLINGISEERIMEPYAGGVGDEGIETIIEFVEEGGTLLTFERSDQIVFEHFNVPVKDALQGLQQPEFYLPPAVLKLDVNNEHPIGYGMKEKAFAFFGGGRAYEPDGWDAAAGNMRVVATWPSEGRVLASGEMLGDEFLAGRGAVIEVDYDDGKIVMYGFRVQHRAQTQGTFKLFFNALYMTQ